MKNLIFILAVVLLASCSVTKQKNLTKTDTTTKSESDSTGTLKVVTETTTTEKKDTVVNIPGSTLDGTFADSDQPFILEDENQKITIVNGKVTGKVKDRKVPISIDKKTVQKSTSLATAREKETVKQKVEEKNKVSEVKKTGLAVIPVWLWLLLVLLLLIAGVWKFRKHIPFL
jgi:cobalamin biosynthesis Mg chelatase CobN